MQPESSKKLQGLVHTFAANPTVGNHMNANSDTDKRSKRRHRGGTAKRFRCGHEDCGKTYSRAEHLQRHQLNRESNFAITPRVMNGW